MERASQRAILIVLIILASLVCINVQAEELSCICDGELASIAIIDTYTLELDCGGIHGLAFDNQSLWAARYGDGCGGKIYELGFDDSGDMIIVDYIDYPGENPTGITFIGKSLYVGTDTDLIIRALKTTGKNAGAVKRSFEAPGDDCTGLTTDNSKIWNADYSEGGLIHKINKKGVLIETRYAPAPGPSGLAYDGQFIWNSSLSNSKLFKLNKDDLSVVTECEFYRPMGLTYDGNYLWLAQEPTQGSNIVNIYKLDINY